MGGGTSLTQLYIDRDTGTCPKLVSLERGSLRGGGDTMQLPPSPRFFSRSGSLPPVYFIWYGPTRLWPRSVPGVWGFRSLIRLSESQCSILTASSLAGVLLA